MDISDFYKLPFYVNDVSCFNTKGSNEIDFGNITGTGNVSSKPIPTKNTSIINMAERTGPNTVYLNNINIVYTLFDGTEKSIKLNIRYEKRACSAQYDGEHEVLDGNTTWRDIVIKGTKTSSSGNANIPDGSSQFTDRNIYVKQ